MRPETSRAPQNRKWDNEARHARAEAEWGAVCEALRERVATGAMPPDDAYWWTRIAVEEAAALEGLSGP